MPIGLKSLFEPKTLVLVGASDLKKGDETYSKQFGILVKNLAGYKGKIHLVDLSGKMEGSVSGVGKVPKGKDLAVVVLPKTMLTKNLPKILSRVKGILLVSGEIEERQAAQISALAKKKKFILLGPASFGVLNPETGLTAALAGGLKKGNIGLISQKLGVTGLLVAFARERGVGVSKVACVGEGTGLDESDLIGYMAADKKTSAICVYLEAPKDGRKFIDAVKAASMTKPVIIMKGGQVQGIFRDAVGQVKGTLVDNLEELLAGAELVSKQPPMPGERVAVVTNSSGQGNLALRYLDENCLLPATPSEDSSKKITKKVPSAKIGKIVDLGMSAKSDQYKTAVEQLLSDENVDGVMVVCVLGPGLLEAEDVPKMLDKVKSKEKPIFGVVLPLEKGAEILEALSDLKSPVCWDVKPAAAAFRISHARRKILPILEKVSKG